MVFKIPLVFLVFLVVNSQALTSEQSPTELLHLDTFSRIVPEFDAPILPIDNEDEILISDRNI